MQSPSKVAHNIQSKSLERLKLIELLAYWEGRVNATDLERYCDLSRQQISTEFKTYKSLAPDNLIYNASQKANIPSENFQPLLITTDADEYLYWIHHGHINPQNNHNLVETLKIPARKISPLIMRGLVAAIRQQKRLEVDYVSLNNPNHEGRIIAPHSFVNTGLRWHLRAWCEKSNGYRDFVLSRFRGSPELLEKSHHTAIDDAAWNTQITIKLAPDTRVYLPLNVKY